MWFITRQVRVAQLRTWSDVQSWRTSRRWFSCVFPTTWTLCCSASRYVVASWKKETVRQTERENETAWQTEGGERGRILLWQPFHCFWMTFFFTPPAFFGTSKHQSQQSDLARLLCKSWIFIRIFLCLKGCDSAGDLWGSHNILSW